MFPVFLYVVGNIHIEAQGAHHVPFVITTKHINLYNYERIIYLSDILIYVLQLFDGS